MSVVLFLRKEETNLNYNGMNFEFNKNVSAGNRNVNGEFK